MVVAATLADHVSSFAKLSYSTPTEIMAFGSSSDGPSGEETSSTFAASITEVGAATRPLAAGLVLEFPVAVTFADDLTPPSMESTSAPTEIMAFGSSSDALS